MPNFIRSFHFFNPILTYDVLCQQPTASASEGAAGGLENAVAAGREDPAVPENQGRKLPAVNVVDVDLLPR